MKKHCVRILSALFAFAALAITAKGQVIDHVVVKIPFEFVVAGKTLPAGTYTVKRASENNERVFVIDNFDNHTSVLVITSEAKHGLADKPAVTFRQVGGQYLLNKIETASNIYTIPVPRPAALVTATKTHSEPSAVASRGAGGN
jgi:hypothetical protein